MTRDACKKEGFGMDWDAYIDEWRKRIIRVAHDAPARGNVDGGRSLRDDGWDRFLEGGLGGKGRRKRRREGRENTREKRHRR